MTNKRQNLFINIYRSRQIHQLYSYTCTYKPVSRDIFSCTNCAYKLQCFCSAAYIGHSKRMLKVRAKEHKQLSKSLGVLEHISTCFNREKRFLEENKNLLKTT